MVVVLSLGRRTSGISGAWMEQPAGFAERRRTVDLKTGMGEEVTSEFLELVS